MLEAKLYIDGGWRSGRPDAAIAVIDPATGGEIGRAAMAEPADLDDALAAAERGFRIWRATPPGARGIILHRVAALIRQRAGVIARELTQEQGKPLRQAEGELFGTAAYFDDLARSALLVQGRLAPPETDLTRNIVYEPIGPVFAVAPWNLPAMMPGRKIANSLAAGCSVIVKPARETPMTAARLVECCHDAGVPAGVVNLVNGPSDALSQHLIASPVVRKLSFTGSTPVGKRLAAAAGAAMKKVTMELGGHAPVIICADADVDAAVAMLCPARFANAGQSCIAPTRFFVAAAIYEQFRDRFVEATRALRIGRGADPQTDMGPLASARRQEEMERLTADAIASGAVLATGGERGGGPGWFFAPTVLDRVPAQAAIMREEPFGPVTPLVPFDDPEAAIAAANATPYGLASFVFTRDIDRALSIADALEAGLVAINSIKVAGPSAPFGGVKDSGFGREGSIEGLIDSMIVKTVTIGRG